MRRSAIALAMLLPLAAADKKEKASVKEEAFVPLFDGKTMNGWQLVHGKGPGYVPENGLLVCPADGGGNLFTTKEYSNFVFRFEFNVEPGGNNGVGIRAPLEGDAAYQGMEIQILDDTHEKYKGRLKPAQAHGSIYDVVPAKTGFRRSEERRVGKECRL